MPHKYADVGGVATYVHHVGATTLPERVPDLSRGETILCLHCSGGNGAMFADVLADLGTDQSPLAIDFPGHGRSAGLDSLGCTRKMADFAAAFLDKWGIARAVLLGHSMGGAVALRLALERPALVRALVLCASAPKFAGQAIPAVERCVAGREPRPFFRDAYSPKAPPDVIRRGFMENLKTDPRALLGDLEACRDFAVEGELARVRVPTLVVVGSDEDAAMRAGSERLAREIPAATLAIVSDAAHMVPLEQPGALAGAVREFLRELP
ncbi:MAG TPA: alpha/beta hydrolase [Myxococcota bacterium]|nr:alpha/beta hydrolase [Myxococcota bacterium]